MSSLSVRAPSVHHVQTSSTSAPAFAWRVLHSFKVDPNATILSQVESIRRYYHQETGRDLDHRDAIKTLDDLITQERTEREDFDEKYGPVPFPAVLEPVAHFLSLQRYSIESARRIIDHLAIHHTTRGCMWLDPEDRAAVDRLYQRERIRQPRVAPWLEAECH